MASGGSSGEGAPSLQHGTGPGVSCRPPCHAVRKGPNRRRHRVAPQEGLLSSCTGVCRTLYRALQGSACPFLSWRRRHVHRWRPGSIPGPGSLPGFPV